MECMIKCLLKGFAAFFFIVIFSAVTGNYTSFAQARFIAVCPQKKIGKNDYLQVQFKVENASNIEVTNASSSTANNSAAPLSPFANLNFDFPSEPSTHRFEDYILKKGESVNDKVQKSLFIKLDVSKTSCFVGEPIIASYKLYTRLRSETTVTNAPSFDGFSVSELEINDHNAAGVEKYNGREYNVYTLRKV